MIIITFLWHPQLVTYCVVELQGAILVYDITDELSFNKIGQFVDAVKEVSVYIYQ